MKNQSSISRQEKLKYFLLGGLALAVVALLTGAADTSAPVLQFGRYQATSWGTRVGENSGVIGVFVTDTVSGETRTVYLREYGELPPSRLLKNDLKKSFSSIP